MCTGCDRIWTIDRVNYLTVIFTFSTAGRELIERDMPVFESPCSKVVHYSYTLVITALASTTRSRENNT